MPEPSYLALHRSGRLDALADHLEHIASACTLCPHRCGVDRTRGATGRCRTGFEPVIASAGPHFGEESPLVGTRGSGTIFFGNCNLECVFCQNADISQLGAGRTASAVDLADIMLDLQRRGCHNVNFVTPTHVTHAIVRALCAAVDRGFALPLVYNSGGFDSAEILHLLDGVFDIYMPDMKFGDAETAERLCGAPDYPSTAAAAVREMHRQVGDLTIDSRGIARRGLIVRHLVLPDDLSGTRSVIDFIAELSTGTYLNLMDQYRPAHRAKNVPGLGRRLTLDEFDAAVDYARAAGLKRLDR